MSNLRRSTLRRLRLLPLLVLALALVPLALLAAAPQHAYAQSQSFHMSHYDADIKVNTDGSYDVVETLAYVYDSGSFHRGTRIIPLGKVEDIRNISVQEVTGGRSVPYPQGFYDPDNSTSGVPGTFGTTTEGNNLKIRWVYDYTSNSSRTFRLSYHAVGALRVYPAGDQFDWYAIPPGWSGPIYASRVTVTLPQGIDTSKLDLASKPNANPTREGQTITWSANDVNNGFEVGVKPLPQSVISAVKPSWQDAVDREEQMRPFVNLGAFVIGLLVLVLGPLFAIMHWFRKGRDAPTAVYSDYMAEPPSNLPPGLVGTLLDEKADVRDVIATIVDQGKKGNLVIQEVDKGGIFGGRDFQYQQTGSNVDFQHEAMVLNAIFKHGNPVLLSELKNTFYSDLQPIYGEMYQSLVALKYFPENPSTVRARNVMAGIGWLILAGLVGFLAYVMFNLSNLFTNGDFGYVFTLTPAFGLAVTGIIWLATAGSMPRKTDFGSQEAQKWRAFKRYLEDIQKYTNVQAAADKFQKYLPFAVALGVDKQFTSQFSSVPAAMPPYYIPYGWYPGYYPVGVGTQTLAGGGGGGAMPSFDPGAAMQGMSDSFASAMQGMSDSFTSMVNSASSILASQPSSSGGGGGWGGGGGGFGGGGGGGGGGGAD